jgi:hypothetical protein
LMLSTRVTLSLRGPQDPMNPGVTSTNVYREKAETPEWVALAELDVEREGSGVYGNKFEPGKG